MNILVAAATALEIPRILRESEQPKVNEKHLHQAKTLITGVGSVAATFQLTKHLLSNNYDLVLGTGVAGSFTPNLLPGEVIVVQKDCFGDLGVVENEKLRSVFDLNLGNPNEHPFSGGWIENVLDIAPEFNLKSVNGCTVNTVSSNHATIDRLVNKYKPDIETMEGAALHYTCKNLNVPFLHLRAVSNFVGERDKNKWTINLALTNLEQVIAKIFCSPAPISFKDH